MLRRRSGRRCLCRPASRMTLAAKRPPFLPPPRSLRPLRSTTLPDRPPLCAHHAEQPLLCALLTPFPRSPLAFPKIYVILHPSPGPSSLAARLWRFFDGGVGRERTSKAIASPRAQERVSQGPEPVAFHQRCRASPSNPTPPEAAPPDPSSRTARGARRYGRSVSEGRELRQAAAERTAAHTPTPPEGAARLPQR
jgi:hypothetical protein